MKSIIKKKFRQQLVEYDDMYKSVEIQAPNKLKLKHNFTTIFLAGSISSNEAEEWQKKIVDAVPDKPYIFFNPRRDDYDKTLKQNIENPQFKKQVEWELEALEVADYIIMYFDKDTKSPISLLELGLHARNKKLIVCCPEGFWRKGNVDIVCKTYNIRQLNSLDDIISLLESNELTKR